MLWFKFTREERKAMKKKIPMTQELFDTIVEINKSGTTILLVEQNANMALSIANRAYVLETGKIILSGEAHDLLNDESIKSAYLGE